MSPCRAEARAEDARSALTRGPSRSYPWWSPSIRPQPTHTCFRRAVCCLTRHLKRVTGRYGAAVDLDPDMFRLVNVRSVRDALAFPCDSACSYIAHPYAGGATAGWCTIAAVHPHTNSYKYISIWRNGQPIETDGWCFEGHPVYRLKAVHKGGARVPNRKTRKLLPSSKLQGLFCSIRSRYFHSPLTIDRPHNRHCHDRQ